MKYTFIHTLMYINQFYYEAFKLFRLEHLHQHLTIKSWLYAHYDQASFYSKWILQALEMFILHDWDFLCINFTKHILYHSNFILKTLNSHIYLRILPQQSDAVKIKQ